MLERISVEEVSRSYEGVVVTAATFNNREHKWAEPRPIPGNEFNAQVSKFRSRFAQREREREGSFSLNCDLDFQPRARWFLGIGIEVSGIVDAEMHGENSWINFWHARKVRSRVDFRLRVLNFRRRKLCMKI